MWPEILRRRIETSRSPSRLSKSAMKVAHRTLPCPCIGMSAVRRTLAALACLIATCASVHAHPVPFSYVDVQVHADRIELSIVAHTYDLANDLSVQPPERLLEPDPLRAHAGAIA